MVTIRNVAKLAGVSTGTVSNVLSGNRPVSDDVRQRVLQAVEDLEYKTNMLASSLVTGRSYTIGAVMSDFQLGLDNFIVGMDAGAREEGFSLLISSIDDDENPADHLRALESRRVDGVIWVVPETEHNYSWWEKTKIDQKIPIVFTFGSSHHQQSSIYVDNFSGGYTATRHLIEHGCKKIGHIAGPLEFVEARDRKSGWEKALKEEGIESNMVVGAYGWIEKENEKCILQMLKQWPDLDGIFAVNDVAALAAIKIIQNNKLRVPEDIKIIGYDDIQYLEYFNPALTTIRQDYYLMGYQATMEILRRIKHPDSQAKTNIIRPKLIIRRSCGCTDAE